MRYLEDVTFWNVSCIVSPLLKVYSERNALKEDTHRHYIMCSIQTMILYGCLCEPVGISNK